MIVHVRRARRRASRCAGFGGGPRAAYPADRCGFVRICPDRRDGRTERRRCWRSEKQLSDEQSRSVAAMIREELGAPAHLAPAPRRPGEDQHLDARKGAVGPPAVHARDHDPARGGARRLAAQGERRRAPVAPVPGDVAPDDLGFYSRPAVQLDRGRLPHAAAVVRRQGARSMPTAPRSSGTTRSPVSSSASPSGSTPPSPSTAWCRCRTSRATSISSPTGRASTG